MSRTGKLHDTLADYEREYFVLVKEQLEQASYGGVDERESALSSWGTPIDPLKKERIRWLANRIGVLRRKLGEPMGSSPVAIIERFVRRYVELGSKQTRGEWIAMSRQALHELCAVAETGA